MNDRLIRGGVAGLLGTLWLVPWNLFSFYSLHFSRGLWSTVMGQLILGHPIRSSLDFVVGTLLITLWNGILGALFVRLIIPERSGNYLLRAIGFAFSAWFILYSMGTVFKIPSLTNAHSYTVLSNWIGITGWGVILGWLTRRWDALAGGEKHPGSVGASSDLQLTASVAGLRESLAEFSTELGELSEKLSLVVDRFAEERRETKDADGYREAEDVDERQVIRLHRSGDEADGE